MFYEEVLNEFRNNYKEKNIHLLFNNGDEKIEFFPELNGYDVITSIQYHVISSKNNNIGTNNTVGYLDHLPFDLLTEDNWSLIEEICYNCKHCSVKAISSSCNKNKIDLNPKEIMECFCNDFEMNQDIEKEDNKKLKNEIGFRNINTRKFIKKEK